MEENKSRGITQDPKSRERTEKTVADSQLPQKERGETHVETSKCVYKIEGELGKGSFGAVFRVRREDDGKRFAMKCESYNARKRVLAHEARVLLSLNMLNSPHFAQMIDSGKVLERFCFLIIKLLGMDLWSLRGKMEDKRFTLNTALKIGEQTLEGLRDLHMVGFLHRDIKPPNFSIGLAEDNTQHVVYVFDFGLSRKICKKGVDLRTPRTNCQFRGTVRYASLAAHDNIEQSRKDDLEAWWYMISEMIIFDLPWKCCKGTDRKGIKTEKMKLREDGNALRTLFNTKCFDEMTAILKYIDSLNYNSIPDYDFIYCQIAQAATVNDIKDSAPVDWDPQHEYKGPKFKRNETYIVKDLL